MGEAYEPRSGCPINATIEVFGDRWSLLVLRDIVFGDRRYFRELQAGSEEGIASNILADRLKRLVELGLLTRQVDHAFSPAVPGPAKTGLAFGLGSQRTVQLRLLRGARPAVPGPRSGKARVHRR
jgi:hypothetical protein